MPAAPPRAAMVLFDIDGTLVRKAGPQHREALEEAGRQISGRTLSMAHIDTVPLVRSSLTYEVLRNRRPHRSRENVIFVREIPLTKTGDVIND